MANEKFKEVLKEKIGIAIGVASMCWSETPKGIFNSSRASEIAEDLEKFIIEYLDSII